MFYLTVVSHDLVPNGLMYHPNPNHGQVIGQIHRHISKLNISSIKLNQNLTYVNEPFEKVNKPGIKPILSSDTYNTH